jgi:hypothetical protein
VEIEEREHFAGRASFEKGREHQLDAVLQLTVGSFDQRASRQTRQANWQLQCELAALGLVEETGGHACPDGMQFQFGEVAFQTKQQPSICRAGIGDAVVVGDETLLVAAQIEERIPVGAIAGQAGDIEGQDDPDLAQGDLARSSLKPSRCCADVALWPRSVAMTTTSSGRQPRETARCSSAYWSRRLSWLESTCCGLDWRMEMIALRASWRGVISSEIGMYHLVEERSEFVADLLLQVWWQLVPDVCGTSRHESCTCSARVTNSRSASKVSLVGVAG